MKPTLIRLALGLCILALASTSAWAIPPYCWDACEVRQANYHCSYPPFGTITCGEYCTVYCPGSCGELLTEDSSFDVASWQSPDFEVPSSEATSEESLIQDDRRLPETSD